MFICKICKSSSLVKKFEYFKRPHGETIYAGIDYGKYHRIYYKCLKCEHYSGYFKMKINNLYSSTYNDAVYSGKIKKNFDKINNLPSSKSDNYYRVKRIDNFLKKKKIFKGNKKIKILDVGSGLGIFPFKMRKKKYDVTALDPDKRSCLHLTKNLKVKAVHGDFLKIKIKKKFQLVTLNKVIEHVTNPQKMLNKVKKILFEKGFVYIEVPDVAASIKGKNREEFYLDHLHVFSKNSLLYLARQNRLKKLILKSVKEPSGKFTVFGIFQK